VKGWAPLSKLQGWQGDPDSVFIYTDTVMIHNHSVAYHQQTNI
jgi:hypothetical protein